MTKQRTISCRILALVLVLLLAMPTAAFAEEPALSLQTDTSYIRAGSSFTLSAGFDQPVETNAIILYYSFDGNVFEYDDDAYTMAAETAVMDMRRTEDTFRITLMVPDWQVEHLGNLTLKVKEDAVLPREPQVFLAVEYVTRDDGEAEKAVSTADASVVFNTRRGSGPDVEGDTNNDYVVDMIDLSNIIDWYGFNDSLEDWYDWYVYFDFNNNGEIDIYDIVYLAQLINSDGRVALNKLIEKAEALNAQDYTESSWLALQEVLADAKAVAADEDATARQISDAINSLRTALDNLEKISVGAVEITFAVTPNDAEVEVVGEDDNTILPIAGNRLVYVLEPGEYTYTVSAEGYITERNSFEVNAAATIIVELQETDPLAEPRSVTFAVTPADAEVEVVDEDDNVILPTADNRLVYQLVPGSYSYVVSAVGYVDASAYFTVTDDMTVTVDLEADVPVVDKSALRALVEEAEALNPADYTAGSWATLENALTDAIAVLADETATQEEVDDAGDALRAALNALESTIDVERLTINGAITLKRKRTMQLSVTITPSNATYQDITWTSLTPSLATVDENGLVTAANATGYVIIQAEAHNGVIAQIQIEITI